jgi:hypothetical protein
MSTAIVRVGNRPESLSAQAEAVRARTVKLLASCEAIRQGAAQKRRESAELRQACRQARLECHLATEWSASQRKRPDPGRLEYRMMAQAIARSLSELGHPAFVFEPSQDTAILL